MANLDTIKGKVAQALIEEMFTELRYTIYHSGVESTFPGFASIDRKGYTSKTAKAFRWLPDFICMRKGHEEEPVYIEVKYSKDGGFPFKKKYGGAYPYPEVFFIIVSPSSITAQKASELEKDASFQLLTVHPELGVDKETALRYVKYCRLLLGNVK